MKIRSIFLGMAVLLASYSFIYAQTEQLTITTYYPSPVGSYSELQLVGKDTAGTCSIAADEGKMYYDSTAHQLRVCQNVSNNIAWQDVSSGGSSNWTLNGKYLYANSNDWSVGIGDDTPTGKLQVVGDEVRIGDAGTIDYASGDGDLYVEDQLEVDNSITTQNLTVTGTALIGWEIKLEGCRDCSEVEAICSEGKQLLGGGCNCNSCKSTIKISSPSPDPKVEKTTWFCKAGEEESLFHAYAICANVN